MVAGSSWVAVRSVLTSTCCPVRKAACASTNGSPNPRRIANRGDTISAQEFTPLACYLERAPWLPMPLVSHHPFLKTGPCYTICAPVWRGSRPDCLFQRQGVRPIFISERSGLVEKHHGIGTDVGGAPIPPAPLPPKPLPTVPRSVMVAAASAA